MRASSDEFDAALLLRASGRRKFFGCWYGDEVRGAGRADHTCHRNARRAWKDRRSGDLHRGGTARRCGSGSCVEAAEIIGFDELHLLGYRDKELADAKPEEIREKLVTIIRRTRPDVVITFDPNGFNVHPDHVAISRFTSDAIAAAADPRWHGDAGKPHVVARLLWTPPLAPWDISSPDSAAPGTAAVSANDIPGIDFVIDVSEWRERRAAALRAHRTQHLSIDRYFFNRPDLNRILDREFWRHAWGPSLQSRPADDILAGCPGNPAL